MGARVHVHHYNLGSADSYIGSSLHDLNSVDGPTRDIDGIRGAVGRDGDSLDNDGHSSSADEKISQAYCPPRTVEGYPCLEYVKYLILPRFNELTVENEKNSGNNFEDIAADYESGKLNPEDLKKALMKALNIMLQPVHDHFKTNENLLEQVKQAVSNFLEMSLFLSHLQWRTMNGRSGCSLLKTSCTGSTSLPNGSTSCNGYRPKEGNKRVHSD